LQFPQVLEDATQLSNEGLTTEAGSDTEGLRHARESERGMIPKKPAPHLMRGGHRFSDQIMQKRHAQEAAQSE